MMRNVTPTVQTYTYDEENRLTGAAGYTYTYDGDGNRVCKSNGNLAANGTLYWYMTPGVVAESDLAGTLKSEYVFFNGERVARRDGATGAGGVFYYFSDHLKTASVITDSAGVIKAESDYYPWGGELQFVNNDSNDYKFTGKKRDLETGLDYFGARYYSNGLGRWVSADWSATPVPVPYADLTDPQSFNLYGFVGGNPASRADPDGHDPMIGQETACNGQPMCEQAKEHSDPAFDVAKGAAKEAGNEIRDLAIQAIKAGSKIGGTDTSNFIFAPGFEASNKTQRHAMTATSIILLLLPGGGEEAALAKSPKAFEQLVSVYKIVKDGKVVYVGISKDLERRGLEHGAKLTEIIGGLNRTQARAIEQVLIEHYGFERLGGTLRNRINSISPTKNPGFYKAAIQYGKKTLEWFGIHP